MRLAVLLLLVLPVAGGDPAPPPERETFTFTIFGDRTGGRAGGIKVLARAVEAANRLDPDFTMTVGDMIQGYGSADAWLAQMREYKAVMGKLKRPWYPVAGNHDVYGGRVVRGGHEKLYQQHFGPLWYSFDYKWAHFVVLYSDEHLSFRNPAKTQNFSDAQLAWLKAALAKTKAKQVYVFLHHPRWLYRGTNWPKAHEILAKDGRVKAVFAGHIHVYRDDGVRDGVHYYTIAVTGGVAGSLKTPASLHHLNHVKVTPRGYTMSVMPVGGVVGADMILGREVDRMKSLRNGGWLAMEHAVNVRLDARQASHVHATIRNTEKTPVAYELRLDLPGGWRGTPRFVGGHLRAGEAIEHEFDIDAPAFTGGIPPPAFLRGTLHVPLRSGLVHPIHHQRRVPIRIRGLAPPTGGVDRALSFDGHGALRVDLPHFDEETFTLECWVRGNGPNGSRAIVSKTESSGFGLWWSDRRSKAPYGVVGFRGHGYKRLEAKAGWDWSKWNHVALCCGKTHVRFFVNGKLQAEIERPGPRQKNRRPLYVGADTDRRNRPSYPFNGSIDEVRLSNVARYEKDFVPARRHARDGHTAVLLHCNAEKKGLFADDSGHDRHGWSVGPVAVIDRAASPAPTSEDE